MASYLPQKLARTFGLRSTKFRVTPIPTTQRRLLNIHEHQAQSLLRDAHIAVPRGKLVTTIAAIEDAIHTTGTPMVLKSQILAGGRGKGTFDNGLKGGIQVANTRDDAVQIGKQMLGHKLLTKQTRKGGMTVNTLYATEKVAVSRELYLAFTIDRNKACPVIIASPHGGTDIEATTEADPQSVTRVAFNIMAGPSPSEIQVVADALQLTQGAQREQLREMITRMASLFATKDAELLEINPLVVTADDRLLCLDSKFRFDNAARNRQIDIFSLSEGDHEASKETEAERLGFSYVKMDGTIGVIVNGAGLALATMDAIQHFGGTCANFLDAGGKATKQTMKDAIRIVLSDDRVKVVLINIYGGIIHGDMVANSLIGAARELSPLRIPIVVRLQGTSAEAGQQLLEHCDIEEIECCPDFSQALQAAINHG